MSDHGEYLRSRYVIEGATYDRLEAKCDRYRDALAELVRLKDGPRDEAYERDKPKAWQAAREALGAALSTTTCPRAPLHLHRPTGAPDDE